MKAKIGIVALFCLMALPLAGCITNDEDKALATWKSTIESGLNQVKTQITTLQSQVAEKASLAQVDQKVAAAGQGNSYPKTETYTKAETERKIADAIQALKDDPKAPWITKAGVKTPSKDQDVGNELDSTDDLILVSEKPIEDTFYLASGELSPYMKLSITNNDSVSHTFRLKVDFDCDDVVTVDNTTVISCDYSYSAGSVMVLDGNIGTGISTSTIGFTSRRSASSTDTTWYIGKARTESIYIRFKPVYQNDTKSHNWSWSFTLKQID